MGVKPAVKEKTLHNTPLDPATKNVKDIVKFGTPDDFQLICKASSQQEGWMKSTKAYEIMDVGCIVQVTTQQRNPDGSYAVAEAVTFVPGVKIRNDIVEGEVQGRDLVDIRERG